MTWTKQVGYVYLTNYACEIWLGVVGSGASTTVTISLSGNANYRCVADIYEYSGIASSPLDKTATNGGTSGTPSTGTTATTTQAGELWIGCTMQYYYAQSTPTNSFTLYDGAGGASVAGVAYLEKIVSSTGTASSGTTSAGSDQKWSGCIATFKGVTSTAYTAALSLGISSSLSAASHWVAHTAESLGITAALSETVQSVFHSPATIGITGALDSAVSWVASVGASLGFSASIVGSVASAFTVGLSNSVTVGLDVLANIVLHSYTAALSIGIAVSIVVQCILNGGGGLSQAQVTAGYLMLGFVVVPVAIFLVLAVRRR